MQNNGKINTILQTGYTLVELLVAISILGIVVSQIFFGWDFINKHIFHQQRQSTFQAETDRMAQAIAAEIRNSPGILSTTSNKIMFLAKNNSDTITYTFLDSLLLKNNDTIHCISQSAYVSQFSLENETQTLPSDSITSALMILTFGMKDKFGNSTIIPLRIMVKMRDVKREAKESSGWNF